MKVLITDHDFPDVDLELALYREYRDVVGLFSHVVETERRFYLANDVKLDANSPYALRLTDWGDPQNATGDAADAGHLGPRDRAEVGDDGQGLEGSLAERAVHQAASTRSSRGEPSSPSTVT